MPRIHTVKANDGHGDLTKVANCHGVSVEELKKLNPELGKRDPAYWLNAGDKIKIPDRPDPKLEKQQTTQTKERCPAQYFIVLNIKPASGIVPARHVDVKGDWFGINLPATPLAPHVLPAGAHVWVGLHFDVIGTTAATYRHSKVQKDKTLEYEGGQKAPLAVQVSKDVFDKIQNLYVWAGEMLASFRRSDMNLGLSQGRIILPRGQEQEALVHPLTDEATYLGSKKLVFDVEILKSPLLYMRREIVTNAASDDIPKDNFGWAWRAHEGREWDYKRKIMPIWGDLIRLGNFGQAVDSGAFSNYHVGYVGAAGGNSLEEMLGLSKNSQKLSTGGDEPSEDAFAITEGHTRFTKLNGPIETKEVHVNYRGQKLTTHLEIHQSIEADLEHEHLVQFLTTYQETYDVLK